MTQILFDQRLHDYDPEIRTFSVSERDVKFDTEYEILNPRTGGTRAFRFSHSTGSEWDPETEWVYKSTDGLTLRVVNDKNITRARAAAYLEAKIKGMTL